MLARALVEAVDAVELLEVADGELLEDVEALLFKLTFVFELLAKLLLAAGEVFEALGLPEL